MDLGDLVRLHPAFIEVGVADETSIGIIMEIRNTPYGYQFLQILINGTTIQTTSLKCDVINENE